MSLKYVVTDYCPTIGCRLVVMETIALVSAPSVQQTALRPTTILYCISRTVSVSKRRGLNGF